MASPTKIKPEQLETISLLSTHEQAMADLYWAYAARFQEEANLFRTLAMAERAHAQWISEFVARARAGQTQINPRRFRPAAFDTSLTFLREQLAQVETPGFDLLTALSVAHDLEEALIERRYFEVLEGDSPELADLLRRLQKETEQHREQVRQAWELERVKRGGKALNAR